jgi:hypothetical protein
MDRFPELVMRANGSADLAGKAWPQPIDLQR